MRRASTYVRELHAITLAVQKFRQYLLGTHFVIRTDHRSLKNLMNQVIQTPEQHQYLSKLLGYDFDIVYKPGRENSAADALSRLGEDESAVPLNFIFMLSTPHCSTIIRQLHEAAAEDSEISALKQSLSQGTLNSSHFRLVNELLFFKNRVFVGDSTSLRQLLIQEAHDSVIGGHSGILKTYLRLSASFYWPHMKKDVQTYVALCQTCQTIKYSTEKPAGLLQPLPVPEQVWEEVSMDFISGLPMSKGCNVIMVIIDRLTKYAHFAMLPATFSAPQVASVFINTVVKLHGLPKSIVSDRDKIFLSKFWTTLFAASGTKLKMSSSYHPQTDGQSEVLNRCVEQYLRAFVNDQPKRWTSYLSWAELWYNTAYHSAIQMTPFEAVYGRSPPSLPFCVDINSGVPAVDKLLKDRSVLLQQLKTNLHQAQNRMCQKANRHRRDLEFNVGDLVLVKLQPYRQKSVVPRECQKLSKRFYGPFRILDRIGLVAYRLELPAGSKIHPVFHVSLLKLWKGSLPAISSDLPVISIGNHPVIIPRMLLAGRVVLKNGKREKQVLVRWAHLSDEENSWESFADIAAMFPSLHLEDKVKFGERGDDTIWGLPVTLDPDTRVVSRSMEGDDCTEESREVEAEAGRNDQRLEGIRRSSRARHKPEWLKSYER